jgi:hypothetical protein
MSEDKRKDTSVDRPRAQALETDRLSERFKRPVISEEELAAFEVSLRSNVKSGNLHVPEELLNPYYAHFWALIDSSKPYESQKYYRMGWGNIPEEEAQHIRAAITDTSGFNKVNNGEGSVVEIRLSNTVTQRLLRIPKEKHRLLKKAYDDKIKSIDESLGKDLVHEGGVPIQSIKTTVSRERDYIKQ